MTNTAYQRPHQVIIKLVQAESTISDAGHLEQNKCDSNWITTGQTTTALIYLSRDYIMLIPHYIVNQKPELRTTTKTALCPIGENTHPTYTPLFAII